MIPVFIPAAPNPSVGYTLMFKREELVSINIKVDEALKFIISCGIVKPEFFCHSSTCQEKEI